MGELENFQIKSPVLTRGLSGDASLAGRLPPYSVASEWRINQTNHRFGRLDRALRLKRELGKDTEMKTKQRQSAKRDLETMSPHLARFADYELAHGSAKPELKGSAKP